MTGWPGPGSPPAAWQFAAVMLPVGLLAFVATGAVLRFLRRKAILDLPNARSSHAVPTPRGGGIAILAAVLPAWLTIAAAGGWRDADAVLAAAGILALVSWRDDRGGLSPALRFLVQAIAVAAGLAMLPGAGAVFQGLLPRPLDLAACFLLWLWFVNLYNFMDGIDGLAGGQTMCLGAGIALVAALHPAAAPPGTALLAAALAAAALGFLPWNWQPARLFMGDVGSVPLGYLLGWLLLALAASGAWAPALILPLYYLVDATWTLVARLVRGARVWEAHREHFYQRAVAAGRRHGAVAGRILAADLLLIGAALWAAAGGRRAGLAAAGVVVGLLLVSLARRPRPAPP